MKTKSIRIRYPSMKLDAILLASKSDKSIEELVVDGVDELFKKTVSKDVQAFLNQMEQEKKEERQRQKELRKEKEKKNLTEEEKPKFPHPQDSKRASHESQN